MPSHPMHHLHNYLYQLHHIGSQEKVQVAVQEEQAEADP
jgi:hypothetical protein